MSGPGYIDLDNPGDCKAHADLYERTKWELDEVRRSKDALMHTSMILSAEHHNLIAQLRKELGAIIQENQWQHKRAAFYKSCALSGEVPNAETVVRIDTAPERPSP